MRPRYFTEIRIASRKSFENGDKDRTSLTAAVGPHSTVHRVGTRRSRRGSSETINNEKIVLCGVLAFGGKKIAKKISNRTHTPSPTRTCAIILYCRAHKSAHRSGCRARRGESRHVFVPTSRARAREGHRGAAPISDVRPPPPLDHCRARALIVLPHPRPIHCRRHRCALAHRISHGLLIIITHHRILSHGAIAIAHTRHACTHKQKTMQTSSRTDAPPAGVALAANHRDTTRFQSDRLPAPCIRMCTRQPVHKENNKKEARASSGRRGAS